IEESQSETYDLIVVYSEEDIKSPRDKSRKETKEATPFFGKCDIFNDTYIYFLSKCQETGIRAALAISKDIIGPGLFHGFWTYNKKWIKNQGKIFSNFLYDKFTPKTIEQRKGFELLMSSGDIRIFNDRKLIRIFRDKLKTYEIFKEFAIPSIKIKSLSEEDIYLAKKKLDRLLKEHKYRDDFHDGYMIKDRSRASGLGTGADDFAGTEQQEGNPWLGYPVNQPWELFWLIFGIFQSKGNLFQIQNCLNFG
ncbi:unnamed protein product, partial [marine sediment metagenome]